MYETESKEYKWQIETTGGPTEPYGAHSEGDWQVAPGVLGAWRLRYVFVTPARPGRLDAFETYVWERLLVPTGANDLDALAKTETIERELAALLATALLGGR